MVFSQNIHLNCGFHGFYSKKPNEVNGDPALSYEFIKLSTLAVNSPLHLHI